MPEGDTIHRTAVNLGRALTGTRLTGGQPAAVRGETVSAVTSRGKHLLIDLQPSGLVLHSHMGMSGSWHLYRPEDPWRRSRGSARAVLESDGWVAVCFAAPVCELLTAAQVARHGVLAQLGPDALDPRADLVEARRRLGTLDATAVGEALMDQRVLAGVGNVYRCETLFACRMHPWTSVGALDGPSRARLLDTASALMRANATLPVRRTRAAPGARLYVYGRAGRPCLRCGERIRATRQGVHRRPTFWCPSCQPPAVP